MITNEWAVRCGCGEILEQPDEDIARRALELVTTKHGEPTLLRRDVVVSEWQEVHVVLA